MRILYALLLLFAFTLTQAGDTTPTPVAAATAQGDPQSCAEISGKDAAGQVAQSGGCCKGHKGVCGCRAGKIVCCDKSFDAACACHQDGPLATL
jgi:hypothetical protein